MPFIHYQNCPVCHSNAISKALNAIDYTVSKESFSIWECSSCKLRFTQDIPNQDDIGPYYQAESYISHTDTRKGLVNAAYHFIRNYTIRQKRKLLDKLNKGKKGKVLDIGAGTGAFLAEMAAGGWEVLGLEPDPGARKLAGEKYNLQFAEPGHLFKLESASVDIITLWHVLEHVHQLHEYTEQFKRLLRPGGYLLLALPNYESTDAAYYGAAWAAWDVPRHLYHFSPKSVRQLLGMHGFTLEELKPMWFDPFYISMLSEQYLHGSQHHLKALIKGLQSNKKARSNVESASSIIYIARS